MTCKPRLFVGRNPPVRLLAAWRNWQVEHAPRGMRCWEMSLSSETTRERSSSGRWMGGVLLRIPKQDGFFTATRRSAGPSEPTVRSGCPKSWQSKWDILQNRRSSQKGIAFIAYFVFYKLCNERMRDSHNCRKAKKSRHSLIGFCQAEYASLTFCHACSKSILRSEAGT